MTVLLLYYLAGQGSDENTTYCLYTGLRYTLPFACRAKLAASL